MTTHLKNISSIAIVEPTWGKHVHLPFNLGLVRATALAFPQATIRLIGDSNQIAEIHARISDADNGRVLKHGWSVTQDPDTLPKDLFNRWRKLTQLPAGTLKDAQILFLSSVTATTLTALTLQGLAGKSIAWLHGNAADLGGWRSRNPLRRTLDFQSSVERYVRHGGRFVVLEKHIYDDLISTYKWLRPALLYMVHPVLDEELHTPPQIKQSKPWHIAFAGITSNAKGFPEFLDLARTASIAQPGRFEFNAIGKLHPEAVALDQSMLNHRAGLDPLSRANYVTLMAEQDFLFLWHEDSYYGRAASGVFYDALAFCLPLLARRTPHLQAHKDEGYDIGSFDDNVNTLAQSLIASSDTALLQRRTVGVEALTRLREQFGIHSLAAQMREAISKL